MPTTLEYFSYVFHFQALMAGPVIFYRDYIDFIHGHNLAGATALTVRIFVWSFSLFLFLSFFFLMCIYTYVRIKIEETMESIKKKKERDKFHVLCILFKGCDKNSGHYDEIVLEPSPAPVVIKKVVVSLLCAAMFVTFIPTYPIQKLKGSARTLSL